MSYLRVLVSDVQGTQDLHRQATDLGQVTHSLDNSSVITHEKTLHKCGLMARNSLQAGQRQSKRQNPVQGEERRSNAHSKTTVTSIHRHEANIQVWEGSRPWGNRLTISTSSGGLETNFYWGKSKFLSLLDEDPIVIKTAYSILRMEAAQVFVQPADTQRIVSVCSNLKGKGREGLPVIKWLLGAKHCDMYECVYEILFNPTSYPFYRQSA